MSKFPLTSIVIRTKNEGTWLPFCLDAIFQQQNVKIEIIMIDNNSRDNTTKIAESYNLKILKIKDFLPGKALNMGFEVSKGDYIVALSGHCVPSNDRWLSNLLVEFDSDKIAGVYGKQLPVATSSPRDKRDLYTTFGPERRIQHVDPFFHNANSVIPKKIWEKHPFNESVTNVEDRIWGKEVIAANYSLIYTPNAAVYHWHGINHDGDENRAINVVNTLENNNVYMTNEVFKAKQAKNLNQLKVIVTVRESDIKIMKFDYFQNFLKKVCEIFDEKNLIVIPDSHIIADKLKILGFNVPFIRDKFYSMEFVDIRDVLRSIITRAAPQNFLSSYILYLNANFPLRNLKRIKEAEIKVIDDIADVICHVAPLGHSTIEKSLKDEGESILLYMDEGPRSVRKNKKYSVLTGFGTFYKINYLLNIDQERPNIKTIEVDNSIETLELKNKDDWNSFRDQIEN